MEVKDFFTLYADAAWNKDPKAMIALYDKKAIIFDMWEKGFIDNAEEWAHGLTQWLGGLGEEKVKVQFDMIQVRESGDTAFASALIHFQALTPAGAVLRQMKNRITVGLIKKGEQWKVVHQHVSAPVSPNGMRAVLDIG